MVASTSGGTVARCSVAAALAVAIGVGTAALCGGCKASEAPASGFIEESQLMTRNPKVPFNKGYWNRSVDPGRYTELYVAPVNTRYVMAQNIWEGAASAQINEEQIRQNVAELAQYMRDEFKRAATGDPQRRFTVVEQPGPSTIVLEIAITQLVPSKAALNALGFVTWIPTAVMVVGSKITESEDQSKGVIAVEARLRDGGTGEVVGLFADRERPPAALVDLKSVTWWAPCKAVITTWAQQFVEIANNPGRKVADSGTFELLTW